LSKKQADGALLQVLRGLTVNHHIPGRIRLGLAGPLSADLLALAGDAQALADVLSTLAGIRSVRLNALARSCTIEYDARQIPPLAWDEFLGGGEGAVYHLLAGALQPSAG
jgi:hypothetical protein